jgi:phage-related protein
MHKKTFSNNNCFLIKKQLLLSKYFIVVSTHGFSKTTAKTPPKEIAKAEQIMKKYFDTKK